MPNNPIDKVAGVPSQSGNDSSFKSQSGGKQSDADETTGASPGTAQACDDLGLNSLAANLERLGIKPPGQA